MTDTQHTPPASARDNELATLRGLRDQHGGWIGSVQLAEELGLPPYTVRDTLKKLAVKRMVRRGGPGHWGEYTLTDHGRDELRRTEAPKQLELAT